MNEKSFLSGLEEVIARFAGLVLTLIFFIIYATSRTTVTLDWYGLSAHLIIFWIIYEIVSYILFVIFQFFSKANEANKQAAANQNTSSPLDETKIDQLDETSSLK
jgi:hypothetical protein